VIGERKSKHGRATSTTAASPPGIGRILLKKNKSPVFVIRAVESELMDSNVFWDAKKKKWKWEPGQMAN